MPILAIQPRDALAALGACLIAPDARASIIPGPSKRLKHIVIDNLPDTGVVRAALADLAADESVITALDASRWSLLGTGQTMSLGEMALSLWRDRVDDGYNYLRRRHTLLDMADLYDDDAVQKGTSLRLEIGHPSDVPAAHRAQGSSPILRLSHGTRNALALVAISHLGAAGGGLYRDGYMPLWWVVPSAPTSAAGWLEVWRNPTAYTQAVRDGWVVIRGGWSRPGGYYATMDRFISIASDNSERGRGPERGPRPLVHLGDGITRTPSVQAIIDGLPIDFACVDMDQMAREPSVFLALAARVLLGNDFALTDLAELFAAARPKVNIRTVDRWLADNLPIHAEHAAMLADHLTRRTAALRYDLESALHATAIAEWLAAQPADALDEPAGDEDPDGIDLTAPELIVEEIPPEDAELALPRGARRRNTALRRGSRPYDPRPALENLPQRDLRSAAHFALAMSEPSVDGTVPAAQIPPALAGHLLREGRIRISSYEIVKEGLQTESDECNLDDAQSA